MLGDLIERLRRAGCVAAEEEARLLAESAPDAATLEQRVARRERGEPLAWIVGWADVAGRRVRVDPGVYVPRPQTGELARRAAAALPLGGWLADLCAGSGAIAAWVRGQRPDARVVAVDIDERAVRCALTNGLPTVQASVDTMPVRAGSVDVVTAVAPYVPTDAIGLLPADVQRYEPIEALDGGPDGLAVVEAVVDASRHILRVGGLLLLEIGGDQADGVHDRLVGFDDVTVWRDEEGDVRVLVI